MCIQPNESLIGFDARENWFKMSELWDSNRTSGYLLRVDVQKPLSVDILVWPTVFDVGGCVALSNKDATLGEFHGLELPQDAWENYPLLKDSKEAQSIIRDGWTLPQKEVAVIAISCLRDAGNSGELALSWPDCKAIATAIDEEWQFLGYDIADSGMISGLTNCQYSAAEHCTAVQRWAEALNCHHLFDDVEPAMSFKDWTNQRVREHAPFAVYGLYVVPARKRL